MPSARNQYLSAVCVNLLSLGMGAAVSWTSPYLPLLQSPDSPIGQAITKSEASWIGSLMAIGALIGAFFFGFFPEKVGRIWSLISAAIPQIIWWIIVIFSPSLKWLYLGRFLAGVSAGGTFSLIPLFITEISQDKIRGSLGSFFIVSANMGALLIYVTGATLDYYTTPKMMLLFSIAFIVSLSFLPETPIHLLRTDKIEKAEESLKFYRGIKKDEALSEEVTHELHRLTKKIVDDSAAANASSSSALRSPVAQRGILIGILLISINQLTGIFVFINYTATVFIDAGSNFNPNTTSIIVGVLMLVGPLVSLSVVEKYSRKFIYNVTTTINIIALMTMGIFSYYKTFADVSNFKYVPVLSLCLAIFISMCGRFPLTYIMMAEIIPQNVRSFGISTCTFVNWALSFVLLKSFSTMVDVIQFHSCMFLFSGLTLLGMILVILYVPETKNRSFVEIELKLMKTKGNGTSTEIQETKHLNAEKV